ncbi:MAG: choice-of-anchor O protein [Sulfurimonas sp.]|nr:choice-of-anchor O protein [Sulfurimonas sp.]
MKTKLTYSIITALVLSGAAMINGCSSSGSSDAAEAVTQTGTFVDSAVEGLSYKGVLSGTTDGDGHYLFKGTDQVEFLLGTLSMGSLTPKTSPVSVLDFFGSTTTIDDEKVQKLIVLLQSLDVDGDASNGITISAATIAVLEAQMALLHPNQTLDDLTLAEMTTLVTAVVTATAPVVIVDPETNTTTTVNDEVVSPEDATDHFTESLYGPQPPVATLSGTTLACDSTAEASYNVVDISGVADAAADFNASQTLKRNVSATSTEDAARQNSNSHNSISSLENPVLARSANGELIDGITKARPIALSYNEQVVGEYEMGDGSADIGDPDQRDAVFFSLSLDGGLTWSKKQISASEDKSSIKVTWNGTEIDYYGHTQKPSMAIEGRYILLAWNDKYCPSGNPLKLEQTLVDGNITYPADVFAVNGTQGVIDYEAIIAPNGKTVYEVPFSCVWTARGIIDGEGNVTWHAPMQLTTGSRDSNHIWIEGSEAGFAMTWQEDTTGLRSGKGEGPGDGWSGATTNHGSDIWYTSIKWDDFDDVNGTDENTTKPKSMFNFHYPVRITDNEKCAEGDTKPYCQLMCDTYGSVDLNTSNNAETAITRCKTYDVDMLTNTQVVLDGDTGASRSALKILETDQHEFVVVFGYEETKGLSESTPGEGDQDQGDAETIIALEGKSVYFESFPFNAIDAFDENNISTILTTPMPMVSAGNIINVRSPDQNTSELIYENARRLVIGEQIDSCNADKFTFAFMYKQSFETQGSSSDMFVRVNNGFTYDSFIALEDRNVTNISAQEPIVVDNIVDYNVTWTSANLDDYTYNNMNDNTFSPRIFLRGNNIFTGFEYTPNDVKTQQENMPSNFHTHIYLDGVTSATGSGWQGPVNVTQVTKGGTTTVDARFVPTGEGNYVVSGLDSDRSNPNVLFVTWGEIDWIDNMDHNLGKAESNLYYKRALFDAITSTWNWDANTSVLANKEGAVIQEKEVETFARPDGKVLFNAWLQEEEEYNSSDPDSGLDTWFGRVDYNISNIVVPD